MRTQSAGIPLHANAGEPSWRATSFKRSGLCSVIECPVAERGRSGAQTVTECPAAASALRIAKIPGACTPSSLESKILRGRFMPADTTIFSSLNGCVRLTSPYCHCSERSSTAPEIHRAYLVNGIGMRMMNIPIFRRIGIETSGWIA